MSLFANIDAFLQNIHGFERIATLRSAGTVRL